MRTGASGLIRFKPAPFRRTRVVVGRLADQAMWSGGFFLFNLALATSLSIVEYAAVTVASSIGVIVTASVRCFAIDGRIIAGARASVSSDESLRRGLTWASAGLGGVIAAVISGVWIALSPQASLNWTAPALAFALVAADAPHYLLTMARQYLRSASIGFLYLCLGAVALISGLYIQASVPVGAWVAAAIACSILGLALSRKVGRPKTAFPFLDISWRLSAEALYSALGGQLGILIIFLVSDSSVTVGVRLAYSIVFAPIFMIIQGLTPLYLGKMADTFRRSGGGTARLAIAWVAASWIGLTLAAILGFALVGAGYFSGTAVGEALPYLAPVGMSMGGNLALDAALLAIRFSIASKYPHRVRLVSVAVELILQLLGILLAGVNGLVAALVIGGAVKIVAATGILIVGRRNQIRNMDLPLAQSTDQREAAVHEE